MAALSAVQFHETNPMGSVLEAVQEVLPAFQWNLTDTYVGYEQSQRIVLEITPRDWVLCQLYRFHTGRYELTAYVS